MTVRALEFVPSPPVFCPRACSVTCVYELSPGLPWSYALVLLQRKNTALLGFSSGMASEMAQVTFRLTLPLPRRKVYRLKGVGEVSGRPTRSAPEFQRPRDVRPRQGSQRLSQTTTYALRITVTLYHLSLKVELTYAAPAWW